MFDTVSVDFDLYGTLCGRNRYCPDISALDPKEELKWNTLRIWGMNLAYRLGCVW